MSLFLVYLLSIVVSFPFILIGDILIEWDDEYKENKKYVPAVSLGTTLRSALLSLLPGLNILLGMAHAFYAFSNLIVFIWRKAGEYGNDKILWKAKRKFTEKEVEQMIKEIQSMKMISESKDLSAETKQIILDQSRSKFASKYYHGDLI